MSFTAAGLIGGLIFSGIGFVVFRYGKSNGNARMIILGVALMGYSYLTPSAEMTWLVGAALTSALYFLRDWLNES